MAKAKKVNSILPYTLFVSFLCILSSAHAQTSLSCGQLTTASLDAPAEEDRYTINATTGDAITLRLTSATAGFTPRIELYDTANARIASSTSEITLALAQTGVYTVVVKYNSGSSQTGNYLLIRQNTKNSCGATAVVCGTVQTASLDQVLELDAYTFNIASSGDALTLRLASATASFTPRMQLYDPDGLFVTSSTSEITRSFTKAGSYTLLVSYNSGSVVNGSYRLTRQNTKNPCNTSALTCGTVQTGSIDQAGELDAHTFSAAANETITLRIDSATPNFNAEMELYDPDGLFVTSSTSAITRTLTKSGTYTVLVLRSSGSNLTGGYRLLRQNVKNPCNAVGLACGAILSGSLYVAGEIDAITITAAASDVLKLKLLSTTTDFNPRMELYDPDGQLVTSSATEILRTLTKTGNHTLLILYSSGNSLTGAYRLTLQRPKNPCGAAALACGTVLNGAIDALGEIDALTFNAVSGDVMTLRLASATANFVAEMELYDPDGLLITSSTSEITRNLTKAGAYTVLVLRNSGTSLTGSYRLIRQNIKLPCNSAALACGTTQSGAIDTASEVDVFTFDGTTGDTIVLRLGSTTANFVAEMELYDPDGQSIISSISEITRNLTKNGIYKLLVSRNSGTNLTGGYRLSRQNVKNPCSAIVLACGTNPAGTLATAGEIDSYTFSGTMGDPILLRIASTTSSFTPQIRLYDPNGQLLDSGSFELPNTLTKTGVYLVLVMYSSGNVSTGNYRIALQRLNNLCNPTPLACGLVRTSSLDPAEIEVYTFDAVAGDAITLRSVATTDSFTFRMNLYAPDGTLVDSQISTLTKALTQTGAYKLMVRSTSGADAGDYQMILQRTKNPCNATPLVSCQTIKAAVNTQIGMGVYVFDGVAGQTATVRANGLTTNFVPRLELYGPDGILIRASSSITETLIQTGQHTLLIAATTSTGMTGNYTLSMGNIRVALTTPNGGEVALAGSPLTITWESGIVGSTLIGHDIFLSTDGGVTYPVVIASNLPAIRRSFDWNIPHDLSAGQARIRIVAKDATGNNCQDESDGNFTVLGVPATRSVSYRYDELNRLTQVSYDDGGTINYTYDAAGNRLSETVAFAPAFRLTSTPALLSGGAGRSTNTALALTSLNGFTGTISLSCIGSPPGVTCNFTPNSIQVPANGTINSLLTVTVASSVLVGGYNFQVTGTGGGLMQTIELGLSVNSATAAGYEADVIPRPNGSGAVTLSDLVLAGRFASRLDTPNNGNEFQRADSAPRESLGDGLITIADWVQAGRYASGLDPLTPSGGPTNFSSSLSLTSFKSTTDAKGRNTTTRNVRLLGLRSDDGRQVILTVEFGSLGSENALGFSLSFNTSQWQFVEAKAGKDASGAYFNTNITEIANGHLGIALALPTGKTFATQWRQIAVITLASTLQDLNTTFPVEFADHPIAREVVDTKARILSSTWNNLQSCCQLNDLKPAAPRPKMRRRR